jgi:hypothetical protein
LTGSTNEELADGPFAGTGLFNSSVFDFGFAGTIVERDLTAQEFSKKTNFATALLKFALRNGARCDDLTAANAGDATYGNKDATLTGKFCQQAHDARRVVLAVDHEDITNTTQAVTRGVEYAAAG